MPTCVRYSPSGHKEFDTTVHEHLKCKENSKDQLYHSDRRTQYLITTCQGKGSEKDYIWITESLHCTPETNNNIVNQVNFNKNKCLKKLLPFWSRLNQY